MKTSNYMRTSTKVLIILAIVLLVPSAVMAQYLFRAIVPTENGFVFNMDALAWTDLVFMSLFSAVFFILFIRFLKILKLKNMIFVSLVPLTLFYGFAIAYLTAIKDESDLLSQSVKSLMSISAAKNNYSEYLWAGLLTIVYLAMVFIILAISCKPLSKVEKVTGKLGDGRLKSDNFKIGGGKQFKEIEHSLNKINFNYQEKDKKVKMTNLRANKLANKQLFKFFGTNAIDQLELGNQITKTATVLLCDLKSKGQTKSISLEENFNYINSYLKTVCPLIKRYEGFVDKYFGDGILAVFSKPREAIECAHAIVKAIEVKNKSQKEKPAIDIKIAINTADVTFAILGEDEQKLPTIVSNAQEILSQMEEINMFIGTKILISKSSISSLEQNFDFAYRYVGALSLDGDCQMQLFESLCYYPKGRRDKLLKLKNKFEEGVRQYNLQNYEKAKENFEFVLHYVADDEPSYVYFNKSTEKLSQPA